MTPAPFSARPGPAHSARALRLRILASDLLQACAWVAAWVAFAILAGVAA